MQFVEISEREIRHVKGQRPTLKSHIFIGMQT